MFTKSGKRKVGTMVAMFLAGLLMAGSALDAFAAAPKKRRIAVFVPAGGVAYFQQKMYGYITESEKLGLEIKIFDAGSYANLNKHIAQIEDAITAKFDGLIVNAVSRDGVNPVIEKAIKMGIPLVNEDVLASSPKIKCRTSEDSYNVGRMEAIFLAEALKGKGKIIHLLGPPGADIFMVRAKGTKEYLSKFPQIKTVAEHHMQHDVGLYTKIIDDFLQGHPDVNAIITNSGASPASLGIANALQAARKKPGDIIVVNVDLDGETPRLIKEGWVTATILCEPVELARASVRLVRDMMEGKSVPAHYYTKEMLVTKNTIDTVDQSGQSVPDDWYTKVRQYLK
jgi:ribose transport system substrate-binding protein